MSQLCRFLRHKKALLPVTNAYAVRGKNDASGKISHIMQGFVYQLPAPPIDTPDYRRKILLSLLIVMH